MTSPRIFCRVDWRMRSSDNAAEPAKTGPDLISRALLRDLYVYRGDYVYGAHRDFFSNELIEAYAKAWMLVGDEEAFRAAWALKPDMPYAPFQLGYLSLMKRDYKRRAALLRRDVEKL